MEYVDVHCGDFTIRTDQIVDETPFLLSSIKKQLAENVKNYILAQTIGQLNEYDGSHDTCLKLDISVPKITKAPWPNDSVTEKERKEYTYVYVGMYIRNTETIYNDYLYDWQRHMLLKTLETIELYENDPKVKFYTILTPVFNYPVLQYIHGKDNEWSYNVYERYVNTVTENMCTGFAIKLNTYTAKKIVKYCLKELDHWNRYYGDNVSPDLITYDVIDDFYFNKIFEMFENTIPEDIDLMVGAIKLNHNNYVSRKMSKIYSGRVKRWSVTIPKYVYQTKRVTDENTGDIYDLILRVRCEL